MLRLSMTPLHSLAELLMVWVLKMMQAFMQIAVVLSSSKKVCNRALGSLAKNRILDVFGIVAKP